MVEYYYIDTTAPGPSIIQRGLRWLIDDNDGKSVVLHIPTLGNLDGNLETALGEQNTKNLKKNKSTNIEGTTVNLSSDGSMATRMGITKILCLYSRSKELDKIESRFNSMAKILVVPWISEDISEWVKVRRATKIE